MTNYIIGGALILMALFLVIAVLMQNGKDHRLSGSIAGGAETFFGKTKGKSLDAKFAKATTIITIIFVILVLVLYIMQPEVDYEALMNETVNNAEVSDTVEAEDETVVDDGAVAESDTVAEDDTVVVEVAEDEVVAESDVAVESEEAPADAE